MTRTPLVHARMSAPDATADTFGLSASDWARFHAVQRFAELVPDGQLPLAAQPVPGSATPVTAFSTPRKLRDTFLAPRQPVYECLAPSGDRLLTESDNNLALRSAVDDRIDVLTDDGCADVVWSVDGALWSPDSRYVTAIRTDTTGLERLPIVDWLTPNQPVELVPYTKPGGRKETRSLAILDVDNRQVVTVDIGRAGDDVHVLFPSGWLADGELLFLIADRRSKVLELRRADPTTGVSRLVVDERSDTFVYGVRLEAFATNAALLPDRRHLVWMSERDGWRHAYLYESDGTFVRRLTRGAFEIERVVRYVEDTATLFLVARSDLDRPYDVHLCRVGLDGTGFEQLTKEPGLHAPVVAPAGDVIIDTYSAVTRPPRTDLLRIDGTLIRRLAEADTTRVTQLGVLEPEEFRVTALDGRTVLCGALYKPPNFDASCRYPVIESLYAGPQTIRHAKDYLADNTARTLAQLGFVTFEVDGPGTPGRGKVFQDAVYRRFGQYEVAEHANVLHQLLARHDYLDAARVGVIGASWGGYHAIRALLLAADSYHVGVAIYPVVDCYEHLAAAIEPYLGLPQDAPDAYEQASSVRLLGNLRGKLLVVHGTSDVNAPFGATMKLVHELIAAGKHCDLLAVPGMEHTLEGATATNVMDRVARHFLTAFRNPRI